MRRNRATSGCHVQRPLADARSRAADAGRSGARTGARARSRSTSTRFSAAVRPACCARLSRWAARCRRRLEVQVKARGPLGCACPRGVGSDALTVIRESRYRQHDTYWSFADASRDGCVPRGRVLDAAGAVTRPARLTLRRAHPGGPLWRGNALPPPATLPPHRHSVRFYREYFRPATERVVVKERRRGWSPTMGSSSTCTSIAARTREPCLLRGGEIADGRAGDARDNGAIISEFWHVRASPDDTIRRVCRPRAP